MKYVNFLVASVGVSALISACGQYQQTAEPPLYSRTAQPTVATTPVYTVGQPSGGYIVNDAPVYETISYGEPTTQYQPAYTTPTTDQSYYAAPAPEVLYSAPVTSVPSVYTDVPVQQTYQVAPSAYTPPPIQQTYQPTQSAYAPAAVQQTYQPAASVGSYSAPTTQLLAPTSAISTTSPLIPAPSSSFGTTQKFGANLSDRGEGSTGGNSGGGSGGSGGSGGGSGGSGGGSGGGGGSDGGGGGSDGGGGGGDGGGGGWGG